jgi:hypothetical protein
MLRTWWSSAEMTDLKYRTSSMMRLRTVFSLGAVHQLLLLRAGRKTRPAAAVS